MNPVRPAPKHIVIKMANVKEKLQAAREKQSQTQGNPCKAIYQLIFSAETMKDRREWHDIFKQLRGKNLQPRILYPEMLSFKTEGDKELLRRAKTKFTSTKATLQEVLKGLFKWKKGL